jgi:hypothetical protein
MARPPTTTKAAFHGTDVATAEPGCVEVLDTLPADVELLDDDELVDGVAVVTRVVVELAFEVVVVAVAVVVVSLLRVDVGTEVRVVEVADVEATGIEPVPVS